MSTSPQLAFVTLVTSDSYLPGALVVAAALKDVHSSPPIYPDEYDPSEFDRVCLVTPETLDVDTLKQLRRAFDMVIGVEVIEEDTEEGLKLLGRLDLRTVLTKLHVFRLTTYRKIIFLDADVLPLRPISHLFRISAALAAVPDVGWPDIFNSGFFVLEPSEAKFKEIMEVVKSKGSWDGGDQGALNEWAGRDWERLSFTYNTTPTAVYTYAPAYRRFGSQISNIHFIGPNKPWLEAPLRSPGASSSASIPASLPSQEFEPPTSYGYPALLDRWFAVYDKHYRLTPATPQSVPAPSDESTAVLKVQRYFNVWNSDIQSNDEADTSGVGAPLGLEELRHLALEGVGKSETGDGEATYHSLPLEGRIDLMRPKKVNPDSETTYPRAVRLVLPEEPHTPVRHSSPMTTLPTPGPHELPPAPVFRGHSLPPETPTHARPAVEPLSFLTPDHDHLPQVRRPSPPPSLSLRSTSPGHSMTPTGHGSPPLVSWDPAVEGPPNAPPPESHFPEDTYFPNVWDAQSHHQPAPKDNGGLFPMPPMPNIPEMLIKEGHYQAVIGESKYEKPKDQPHQDEQIQQPRPQGQDSYDRPPPETQPSHESHSTHQLAHPQPDRSKVATVFPWEEKPRHAPVRFFPPADSPPPGPGFIKPQSPALKLNLTPPTTAHRSSPMPMSRQQGFPRTTTYTNVWDEVPSIQRYASRLMGPTPPLPATWTPDAGPTRKGNNDEYQRWQDLVEVSSRDADDEDEGDDEDSRFNGGAESDRSQTPGEESSSLRKSYKGRGVQTVQRETKNQSVQVSSEERKQVTRSALGDTAHRDLNNFNGDPNLDAKASDMSSTVSELPSASVRSSTIYTETSKVGRNIISPLSPPDGGSKASPGPRPAGRTFDPARGVDIFKKGSEEVLARFLKINSWEDDTVTGTNSPIKI